MDVYIQLIHTILILLLRFGVIAGILFLAVKTKSKGITLIGITEIMSIVINAPISMYRTKLYTDHFDSGGDLENLPTLPSLLNIIENIDSYVILVLIILGIYIVYREYKANKFCTPQSTTPD